MKSPLQPPPNWFGGFILGQSPLGGTNSFPVAAGLQKTIKSYLYSQYTNDDNLAAFVTSYNALTQAYLDWFNSASLPVYTLQQGSLLDWIANNLYGLDRPLLPNGHNHDIGEFNTYELNTIEFNQQIEIGPQTFYQTTDDVFQRIMTWALYKGDGKVPSIKWLKRRVMRFLVGENGTGGLPMPSGIIMSLDSFGEPVYWPTWYNIDNTYQISIIFAGNEATIRIVAGVRHEYAGAIFNTFELNGEGAEFNSMFSTFTEYGQFAMAPIFQAVVEAGAIELPGPYSWAVQIG